MDEGVEIINQQSNTDDLSPNLRSQIVTSSLVDQEMKPKIAASRSHGGRRTLPYVFTEQGVAMLSSVLRSPRAVEVNIAIMRTFVQLRRLMDSNALLAEKIHSLEAKYSGHDDQFQVVFDAIRSLITTADAPKREIGFRTDWICAAYLIPWSFAKAAAASAAAGSSLGQMW